MSQTEFFQIPSSMINQDRRILEFTMMAQFISHNKEEIESWIYNNSNSKNEEKNVLVHSFKRFLDFLDEDQPINYSESILKISQDLKNILHSFNYGCRLNIGGHDGDLLQLERLQSGVPYVFITSFHSFISYEIFFL